MADLNDNASWSQIDASNNTAPPNGWPEGMAPAAVNDTGRAVMGAVKRWHDQITPTLTSGGSANAQTLTYAVAPAAYVAGDEFTFIAGFGNSGATTLNVNGLGALAVVTSDGAALTSGEIQGGAPTTVYHDGTQFRLEQQNKQLLTANGGYLRHPGGLTEIWGFAAFVAVNTVAVTFPAAITLSDIYGVTLTVAQAAGGTLISGISNLSTAGFTANLSAAATTTVYWRALGK